MLNQMKIAFATALLICLCFDAQKALAADDDMEETYISDHNKKEFSGIVQEDNSVSNNGAVDTGDYAENKYNDESYESGSSSRRDTTVGENIWGSFKAMGSSIVDIFSGIFGGLYRVVSGKS